MTSLCLYLLIGVIEGVARVGHSLQSEEDFKIYTLFGGVGGSNYRLLNWLISNVLSNLAIEILRVRYTHNMMGLQYLFFIMGSGILSYSGYTYLDRHQNLLKRYYLHTLMFKIYFNCFMVLCFTVLSRAADVINHTMAKSESNNTQQYNKKFSYYQGEKQILATVIKIIMLLYWKNYPLTPFLHLQNSSRLMLLYLNLWVLALSGFVLYQIKDYEVQFVKNDFWSNIRKSFTYLAYAPVKIRECIPTMVIFLTYNQNFLNFYVIKQLRLGLPNKPKINLIDQKLIETMLVFGSLYMITLIQKNIKSSMMEFYRYTLGTYYCVSGLVYTLFASNMISLSTFRLYHSVSNESIRKNHTKTMIKLTIGQQILDTIGVVDYVFEAFYSFLNVLPIPLLTIKSLGVTYYIGNFIILQMFYRIVNESPVKGKDTGNQELDLEELVVEELVNLGNPHSDLPTESTIPPVKFNKEKNKKRNDSFTLDPL